MLVAPYVGAWIETLRDKDEYSKIWSHPMWVRGLKHQKHLQRYRATAVAPYVGAWIETALGR